MSYYLVLTVLLTFAVLSQQLPTDEAKPPSKPETASTKVKKYVLHTEEVNWYQAVQLCNKNKQSLASIMTRDEYDSLLSAIKSANITGNVWTSGSDLADEGKYVWQSNGQIFYYNNWAEEEPRHHLRISPCEYDHCIQLLAPKGYKMDDIHCSNKNNYACEYYE